MKFLFLTLLTYKLCLASITGIEFGDSIKARRVDNTGIYEEKLTETKTELPCTYEIKEGRLVLKKGLSPNTFYNLCDLFEMSQEELLFKFRSIFKNPESDEKTVGVDIYEGFWDASIINALFLQSLNIPKKNLTVVSKRTYLNDEQSKKLIESFNAAGYNIYKVVPESTCLAVDMWSRYSYQLKRFLVINTQGTKTVASFYEGETANGKPKLKNHFHHEFNDISDYKIKKLIFQWMKETIKREANKNNKDLKIMYCPVYEDESIEHDLYCNLTDLFNDIIFKFHKQAEFTTEVYLYDNSGTKAYVFDFVKFDLNELRKKIEEFKNEALIKVENFENEVKEKIKNIIGEEFNLEDLFDEEKFTVLIYGDIQILKIMSHMFTFNTSKKGIHTNGILFGTSIISAPSFEIEDPRIYLSKNFLQRADNIQILSQFFETQKFHKNVDKFKKLGKDVLFKNLISHNAQLENIGLLENYLNGEKDLKTMKNFNGLLENMIKENELIVKEKEMWENTVKEFKSLIENISKEKNTEVVEEIKPLFESVSEWFEKNKEDKNIPRKEFLKKLTSLDATYQVSLRGFLRKKWEEEAKKIEEAKKAEEELKKAEEELKKVEEKQKEGEEPKEGEKVSEEDKNKVEGENIGGEEDKTEEKGVPKTESVFEDIVGEKDKTEGKSASKTGKVVESENERIPPRLEL